MRHLRRIDQVAYVRFASVYKEFRDVSDIMEEISNLGKPKK
jgi:transcriptional repressor NrdR